MPIITTKLTNHGHVSCFKCKLVISSVYSNLRTKFPVVKPDYLGCSASLCSSQSTIFSCLDYFYLLFPPSRYQVTDLVLFVVAIVCIFLYNHNYINILVYDFNTFSALISYGSIHGNITYFLSWGINLGELTCSEDSSWAFNELRWHCCILEFLPYLLIRILCKWRALFLRFYCMGINKKSWSYDYPF